jgi:microcystin degradation protein MlrC
MIPLVNRTARTHVKAARPRVAALGLFHESNTFAPRPAGYRQFEESGIHRGDELVAAFAGSRATMGGYLAATDLFSLEVVPLAFAQANPMGIITRDAFERLAEELIALLERNGPWDAVLLAQHGAAVAEHAEDADGEFVARVRSVVGPDVPIGLSLDLHANVSTRMSRAPLSRRSTGRTRTSTLASARSSAPSSSRGPWTARSSPSRRSPSLR